VHLVTIKPVLYGGISARLVKVPNVVYAISGLGSVFTRNGFKAQLFRKFITTLYKYALGCHNACVIFQNVDDQAALLKVGAVTAKRSLIIRGSGVDLNKIIALNEPTGTPVVAFAARLLEEKGVRIFVDAAQQLQSKNQNIRFWLIGKPDPGNPSSVSEEELSIWSKQGIVETLGFRTDIPELFSQVHIVTLPSYYGEGLPKVLIEAAASGRAVITTDHPGCRDAIEEGVTGLLIPVRDSQALATAIEKLINDKDLRCKMGKAGRTLAEREFSINRVVQAHLDIYKNLPLGSCR
jgi:glycosyltransferase involved in cell wall biosynthesis